jgi:hypothetical protein
MDDVSCFHLLHLRGMWLGEMLRWGEFEMRGLKVFGRGLIFTEAYRWQCIGFLTYRHGDAVIGMLDLCAEKLRARVCARSLFT